MGKTQLKRALQIAAAIIIIALAVGLYRAKSEAARTEARVRELQAEIGEREAHLRALRAQIAAQESPARIEALAEEELGLVAGRGSAALPERAIAEELPPPRRTKARE